MVLLKAHLKEVRSCAYLAVQDMRTPTPDRPHHRRERRQVVLELHPGLWLALAREGRILTARFRELLSRRGPPAIPEEGGLITLGRDFDSRLTCVHRPRHINSLK